MILGDDVCEECKYGKDFLNPKKATPCEHCVDYELFEQMDDD